MKNKRKALWTVCLAALLISLASGCSKKDSEMTLVQTESQSQNAGTLSSDKTTEAAGSRTEENPMQTVLQALAVTTGDGGLHYNSGDPVFIWTALSHAVHADGQGENVPEETLRNYLSAFFEGVEDLPPLDGSVQSLVSYDEAANTYTFAPGPDPEGTLFLGEPEDLGDGSCKIKGEYMAADGWEKLSGWIFFVKPSKGAYPYVVQYMENEDYLCSDIYEELQSLTAAETTSPQ